MIHKLRLTVTFLLGIAVFSACENPMTYQTKVYEDGTFDKTIAFEKNDSAIINRNMFAISEKKGWSTKIEKLPIEEKDKSKQEFHVTFKKHFNSVEEMNSELNTSVDTLFQIKSTFEKQFRWFYTYIRYTETFEPINRFKMLPIEDYINREDHQFIERLPSEGSPVSKADSLYLQTLNVKIYDVYGNMAIFNEEYDILTRLMKRNNLEQRWFDTLARKRDFIYNQIDKMKGDPNLAIKMADTLEIPLQHDKARNDARELSKDLNARESFMGFAKDGKYKNVIDMPWQVVDTNADSVSGNTLYWHPVVTKFLVTKYVMYGESRKLNVWAVFVSGLFLLLTLLVWIRRGKV